MKQRRGLVVGMSLLLTMAACPSAWAVDVPPWRTLHLQKDREGGLAMRLDVIQTPAQLQRWLQSPSAAASPLIRMPPALRQAWIDSMVFRDGGLSDYAHESLLNALPAADAYELLGVFGLAHELAFLPGVRVVTAADHQALVAAREALQARQDPHVQTVMRAGLAVGDFRPARVLPTD